MNPFDIDNEVILELIKSDPTLRELYGFSDAESEAPMADVLGELSQYSRGDDRNLAHVAPGDTIIPPELLEADPEFADLVYGRLEKAGINPAKRVVDSGAARRNPVTGAQEFDAAEFSDFYSTAADIYSDLTYGQSPDYSFEDFYNDMLNMDAQQQQDFLRSQGLLPDEEAPYTGAPGGTGPITDETRYGDPTQRPGYTPPTTTTPPPTVGPTMTDSGAVLTDLLGQLQRGEYSYGDAGAARDSGLITPEQHAIFTEAFNKYTGTAPGQRPYSVGETVTGPYTPPATTTPEETETTSSATAGTVAPPGSRTYAGIPQEILDRIEVGIDLPIPGPGNMPLPIIFGSVQEFIDWVQSVGIDPTTGNPDDFLGTLGRVVGDIYSTATDAFKGAVQGATTGQTRRFQDFVRDMILAGQTDAGTIVNAAQDAGIIPSGGGGAPSAGTPPGTAPTGGRGGAEPDFALPGGEEEDEDQAPAEPGVPNEEILGQMGTNQEEVLGKVNEAIAQGASNAEALEQVAQDLGTTKEELLSAMGTTEENLIDYMEGMEGRINERLDTLGTNQQEVLGKVNQAIAQGASNAEALEQVARDLGTTKEELLGALGTTEENLMDYVDSATERVLEQMGTNQEEVISKVNEAIAQGASNAEALEQVAQDLGTTKEELLGAMGTTEENLKGYMDGVEGRLTERLDTLETGLYDKMQENLDAGMTRADAIDKALEDLATEQGKSKDEILDQMGTNQDALMGRMDELEEGFTEVLGEVRDDLTDLINAGIEAGKTQAEALGDALEELAKQQGKSTEELKEEIGLSEDRIIDALGGFEERMFDQMGADKDDIIDRVDDAIEQGKSNGEALADLAEELGVSVEYLTDALGTTEENLTDLINESQTAILDGLGTSKAEILDSVNEAIAEGKSANEALDELAEQLGTTKEDLLDAVDVSTETIMDELAAFEERQNERLGNATDEIISKVNDAIEIGQDERAALGDALDEIADDLGMTREEILDQLGTTEDRILDEIGVSTDVITRDISDLGTQTSLQNFLQLLSQPGVTSQRVDVRETPLANIEDIYDFATIFRTPEQAEFYAAALEDALASGAITEEELRALLSRA